jgi:hypothetical protein
MKGWVYIITNKAMPNLVKVGYSTKDPELRAEELHTTGVPHRFVVEYDVLVNEPRDIEQAAHNLLKNHHESKEWFNCSIETAIIAIREAAADNILLENCRFNENEIMGISQVLTILSATSGDYILSDQQQEEIEINYPQQIGKFTCQRAIAVDTETSLMWLRFAHGQSWENNTAVGKAKEVDSNTAFEIEKQFNQQYGYAGFTDWRLPTIVELKTLIDKVKGKEGNYIDADVFPNSSRWFWSSSRSPGFSVWFVFFSKGYDHFGCSKCAVRLVRGGQ